MKSAIVGFRAVQAESQAGPSWRASLTNGLAGTAAISSAGHGASSGNPASAFFTSSQSA